MANRITNLGGLVNDLLSIKHMVAETIKSAEDAVRTAATIPPQGAQAVIGQGIAGDGFCLDAVERQCFSHLLPRHSHCQHGLRADHFENFRREKIALGKV